MRESTNAGSDGVEWTRSLELQLVRLVRQREEIWRPRDNTNHSIQRKYRAFAELAKELHFPHPPTARSVRDRWVNIRSTFNHNLRKLNHSIKTASSPEAVYVPSWPLWRACQFLRLRKKNNEEQCEQELPPDLTYDESADDSDIIPIRQRYRRTDRPRNKTVITKSKVKKNNNCKTVIDDLVKAMRPLSDTFAEASRKNNQEYWYFGRHVTERLGRMRPADAECASQMISELLKTWPKNDNHMKEG